MNDPVLMPDGHTYERNALMAALTLQPFSPITHQPMTIDDAVPNTTLKHLIDNWLQNIPETVSNQIDKAQCPDPHRRVTLSQFTARFLMNDEDDFVHIRIIPTSLECRIPLALVTVIDVSGSMSLNACQTVAGMESINLSRLQLVQHALKTIVEVLDENDEITFVTFNSSASVKLEATRMNSEGKAFANESINQMEASGGTNIWDALKVGCEQAKRFEGRGFNVSILLFSDGEPNENPPMGIVRTLRNALSATKQDFTISTFGFGYSIDSGLMENIARLGHGIYGYCPDCTMVGTIFINFLASALATIAQRAILEIRTPESHQKYDLTLMNESSSNILLDISHNHLQFTEIILSIPATGDRFVLNDIKPVPENPNDPDRLAMTDQIYRFKLIDLISENLLFQQTGLEQSHLLFNEIQSMENRTPYLDGLMIDLVDLHPNHGQISKAFDPIYFGKWGKDYLRSHLLFHEAEQCGNFKDESLQHYGGSKFSIYREFANKIFVSIPPPVGRSCSNVGDSVQPVNMARFYDYDGGCFNGDAIVSLWIGTKSVRELKKGDILKDGGIVECLIETVMNCQTFAVVLNGVAFTPFHPIEIDGKWIFPRDISEIMTLKIDSWFNLVVEGNKVVELNGIRAITLGHGLEHGILKHPYFGTELVIEALQKYPAYMSGRLCLRNPKKCERDEHGMIIHLY
jgi:Mg-chelatase subunit ChlD